ncbi:MAG: hypothetical protein JNJ44_03505 [Zoogloeaceae bacterium]|nr:hypothetical protein [Zoogloeaceae bacterium]
MIPVVLARLAALLAGVATAVVLLVAVLSLVGGTTRPEMLGLAGPVVILPAGLVALAAGLYAARRVWALLGPPPPVLPDDSSSDGAS